MVQARFLGHSCVTLTDGYHRLIIDPFITGNPLAPIKADEVEVNNVLVSHGHGDHFGDTIQICKQNEATLIANYEICMFASKHGVKVHPMHIGGAHKFEFGRVKLTIAHHGSGGDYGDVYLGPATGFLIEIGERTIYHPGDTGLFYDMKLIGDMNQIDLAFLPIGDNFTMGIDDAVKAVEFLRPKTVVPIHYDTFPVIEAGPEVFAQKITGPRVVILKPGETLEI